MGITRGTAGDDRLTGTDGDDEMLGFGGNDTLDASQGGFDTLDGGAGDDRLIVGQDGGVVIGGAGTDTVRFDGGIAAVSSAMGDPSVFFAFGTGRNATVQLAGVEVVELNDDRDFDLALRLGTAGAERIG